jgi:hypothetical protein
LGRNPKDAAEKRRSTLRGQLYTWSGYREWMNGIREKWLNRIRAVPEPEESPQGNKKIE